MQEIPPNSHNDQKEKPTSHKGWLFLSKDLSHNTKNIYIYLVIIFALIVIFAIVILGALGYLPDIGNSASSAI